MSAYQISRNALASKPWVNAQRLMGVGKFSSADRLRPLRPFGSHHEPLKLLTSFVTFRHKLIGHSLQHSRDRTKSCLKTSARLLQDGPVDDETEREMHGILESVGFVEPDAALERLRGVSADDASREQFSRCLPMLLAALADAATPDGVAD